MQFSHTVLQITWVVFTNISRKNCGGTARKGLKTQRTLSQPFFLLTRSSAVSFKPVKQNKIIAETNIVTIFVIIIHNRSDKRRQLVEAHLSRHHLVPMWSPSPHWPQVQKKSSPLLGEPMHEDVWGGRGFKESRSHSQSVPTSRSNSGGWNRVGIWQRVHHLRALSLHMNWCSHILCTSVSVSLPLSPHAPLLGWHCPRPPPQFHHCCLKKLGRHWSPYWEYHL